MKDRIYHLRKELLGKSRAKFGEPVGMTDSEIKNLENGLTQLKENKLQLICNAYHVNEDWLRYGTGTVFLPQSRDDEIADIVKAAAQHDPEKAAKFFTDLFGNMSDGEIVLMYEIFRKHFPE